MADPARDAAGVWTPDPATTDPAPPSPAELLAALAADFHPAGWEIAFRDDGTWRALHPSCGLLTATSALGLRDALDHAHTPRRTHEPLKDQPAALTAAIETTPDVLPAITTAFTIREGGASAS